MSDTSFESLDAYDEARADLIAQHGFHLPFTNREGQAGAEDSGFRYAAAIGAAIAVVKVVATLVSMKSSADSQNKIEDALNEIQGRLTEIEARLGSIESKLDAIRGELQALSVKIDELPALAAVMELRGRVDTVIDYFPVWSKDPDSKDNRPLINQTFVDISQSVRTQIRHGFAHSTDVFFGFVFELDLALLLGFKASEIRPSVKRVLRYAADLFDVTQPGSIGAVMAEVRSEIATLEARDRKLDRSEISLGDRLMGTCSFGEALIQEKLWCQLTGDIASGYEIKRRTEWETWWCFENPYDPGGKNKGPQPYDNTRPCPHDLAALNASVARYRFLGETLATLVDLKDKIDEFRASLQGRLDWQERFDAN